MYRETSMEPAIELDPAFVPMHPLFPDTAGKYLACTLLEEALFCCTYAHALRTIIPTDNGRLDLEEMFAWIFSEEKNIALGGFTFEIACDWAQLDSSAVRKRFRILIDESVTRLQPPRLPNRQRA